MKRLAHRVRRPSFGRYAPTGRRKQRYFIQYALDTDSLYLALRCGRRGFVTFTVPTYYFADRAAMAYAWRALRAKRDN
jgi:hypothetical protein